MKLTHIKTKTEDYYIDEQGLKQGEFKNYHDNGQLYEHSFWKNDERHGECNYYIDGILTVHSFYKDGKQISEQEYKEWQLKEKIEKVLV